jgi:hypothetical protein
MLIFTDSSGPGLAIRPGASIPAGTLVGLFSEHVFLSVGAHGTRTVSSALRRGRGGGPAGRGWGSAIVLLPLRGQGGPLRSAATVVGAWWTEGPVPCLLARTARDQADLLVWNLDACSPGGYTSSHAEARAWRGAGHRTVRCCCNALRDCPRDRFICLADDPGEAGSPATTQSNFVAATPFRVGAGVAWVGWPFPFPPPPPGGKGGVAAPRKPGAGVSV